MPSELYPINTALLRFREHMENEHGAAPEDYGNRVLNWHKENYPKCKTLPTFKEAKKP